MSKQYRLTITALDDSSEDIVTFTSREAAEREAKRAEDDNEPFTYVIEEVEG